MKKWKAGGLGQRPQRLVIFILFKNKQRIFYSLKLLQTALVCHRGMRRGMFAYTYP